jgi:SPP1 gp7 family putative phage head morphogenesis protein
MPREPLKLPPVNGLPVHFQEAINAALARNVVLPDVYYGQLQGIARQLAFSIAGIASYDQLRAVLDSLINATANGQTFAQWQREQALKDLNLPKHRLDNIFRTNLQGHYQAGHWDRIEQFKHRRPFLMYDAINDSRVRPAHLAMDNIIRPVDDPFWAEHAPPNGYRCRCGVIALTEAQAKVRSKDGTGLNKDVDETAMQPDKGWDYSPRDRIQGARQALAQRVQNTAGPLGNALDLAVTPALHPPQDLRDAVTQKYFNGVVDVHDPDGLMTAHGFDAAIIAKMTGAPDGSVISIYKADDAIEFNITNALFDEAMARRIMEYAGGIRVMMNDNFNIKPQFQRQGIGARSFARQVSELAESGFARIETYAAGSYRNDLGLNGYDTWARLGYDAPLTAEEIAGLPEALQTARRVQDLMATEAGRAWWEIHGNGRAMIFDLSEESRSRRVLDDYIKQKGIKL